MMRLLLFLRLCVWRTAIDHIVAIVGWGVSTDPKDGVPVGTPYWCDMTAHVLCGHRCPPHLL
jgi:hypothetical protein